MAGLDLQQVSGAVMATFATLESEGRHNIAKHTPGSLHPACTDDELRDAARPGSEVLMVT
jgi:hypothetical protein